MTPIASPTPQTEATPTAYPSTRSRIVIMGAAGRDFHNFNLVYRDDPTVEVVAFTAAQISGISDRTYPPQPGWPPLPPRHPHCRRSRARCPMPRSPHQPGGFCLQRCTP